MLALARAAYFTAKVGGMEQQLSYIDKRVGRRGMVQVAREHEYVKAMTMSETRFPFANDKAWRRRCSIDLEIL
ncbi:hypothetical protein CERZMDRAFT_91528 [Cercospora zeae-maydis SCOH1-5]|uniref:Uncharacterized protein n=1 Tax=Cercospora zeae-maydis SCOH1-5 TaxID=717836 RepID=A0A6A6F5H7_9PEZI|nr:hypothetical protein CERZMDRAFT_91528 [Cercospora zeae-maydis SCOH1-5]